jgi:hypothetical protein
LGLLELPVSLEPVFERGVVVLPFWLEPVSVVPVLPDIEPELLPELMPEVLPLFEWWCFLALPITSIFSARFDAGSKLARTWLPSWIAEMPAATGWPRRRICVCESTVSVTPWSRVMLFWSTFCTWPVTVRRFALSEEPEAEPELPLLWPYIEPEEPEEPTLPDEPEEPVLPLWPYVEPLLPMPLLPDEPEEPMLPEDPEDPVFPLWP